MKTPSFLWPQPSLFPLVRPRMGLESGVVLLCVLSRRYTGGRYRGSGYEVFPSRGILGSPGGRNFPSVSPFFLLMCDSPLFGGPGLSFHLSSVFFPEVILGSPGGRNLLFLSFRLLRSLTLCSRRDARSGPVYAFRRDAVGLMFRGFFF